MTKKKKIITFGSFDCFHKGHLHFLERANEFHKEPNLIIGLSSDEVYYEKHQRFPIFTYEDRKNLLETLPFVKEIFEERSLFLTNQYVAKYTSTAEEPSTAEPSTDETNKLIVVLNDEDDTRMKLLTNENEIILMKKMKNIQYTDHVHIQCLNCNELC
jgi:cytidyltransferase-like protein